MTQRVALVTGFEPYGGHGLNPAGEVVSLLDGATVGGALVVGRNFPVSFAALHQSIRQTIAEVDPAVVVALGLWPGEPVIRLERVGLNVADFEIPDNDGTVLIDEPVVDGGREAKLANWPVRRIEAALLAAQIPARVSNTAGTFLCNATLYGYLDALEECGSRAPCGFMHLPYTPGQAAAIIAEMRAARSTDKHRPDDIASMSLETLAEAVRVALEQCFAELGDV